MVIKWLAFAPELLQMLERACREADVQLVVDDISFQHSDWTLSLCMLLLATLFHCYFKPKTHSFDSCSVTHDTTW